jgi:hypothetical protein
MVGQVGCSTHDFWYNQNPRESALIFNAYIEKLKVQDEMEFKRQRVFYNELINAWVPSGYRLEPQQRFPLKTEKEETQLNYPTEKDFEYWKKKFDKAPAKVKKYG